MPPLVFSIYCSSNFLIYLNECIKRAITLKYTPPPKKKRKKGKEKKGKKRKFLKALYLLGKDLIDLKKHQKNKQTNKQANNLSNRQT